MIEVIEEINGYSGLEYKRYKGSEKISCVRVKSFNKLYKAHKQEEGFRCFLLIDSYGNIIANAYNYLNDELGKSSYKEREGALTALKHLYSFMELFYYFNESDINRETIKKFKTFLKGGKLVSNSGNLMFKGFTFRKNTTVNNYIHVYRKYFKYLKIEDSIFKQSTTVRREDVGETIKYETSSHIIQTVTVPKYISYQEYVKCIKYINQRKKDYVFNLRDTIVIHLMYEYGLRIGEVLGVTIEDIYNTAETKMSGGQLIIRNRYTDKPWQFAKGCMKVKSREDYKDPDYDTKGLGAGYQVIKIEEATVQLIEEYMQETVFKSSLSITLANNLRNKNVADIVTKRNTIKQNKYIMLSKNYTPITGTGWNRNLKEIFEAVGITIDKEKKVDSLNHRYRHGYAMYKIMTENYDKLKLKNALRHRNSESCEKYFNPTDEDIAKWAYDSDGLLRNGGLDID